MRDLQKTKWRDLRYGDWVVVHNPVEGQPVPDHLKPWIGRKGLVDRIHTQGCMGDQIGVQFMNPLRHEFFSTGDLWWVRPPMTSEKKWSLFYRASILLNVILIANLVLRHLR